MGYQICTLSGTIQPNKHQLSNDKYRRYFEAAKVYKKMEFVKNDLISLWAKYPDIPVNKHKHYKNQRDVKRDCSHGRSAKSQYQYKGEQPHPQYFIDHIQGKDISRNRLPIAEKPAGKPQEQEFRHVNNHKNQDKERDKYQWTVRRNIIKMPQD